LGAGGGIGIGKGGKKKENCQGKDMSDEGRKRCGEKEEAGCSQL